MPHPNCDPCCFTCPCLTQCLNDIAPCKILVKFTGIADNGLCEHCLDYNDAGGFILEANDPQPASGFCRWHIVFPEGVGCGKVAGLAFDIILDITSTSIGVSTTFCEFEKAITTPYDCLGINGLDLPLTFSSDLCDCSGATCTIWAL